MAKKIKVNRSYTFKAYNVSELSVIEEQHCGKFVAKSECHYYVEKEIIDIFNDDPESRDNVYAIYKISTVEDSTIPDQLIEIIRFKDEVIVID